MPVTTNDTFDDFTARPLDPHQCYHYVSRHVRCTNATVQNDYFCPEHRITPAPIFRFPEDGFWLPELTDRDSILRALSKIAERLAQNALDAKRAGRLLYACQVANGILDGKLREQQLAFKRDQLDQKKSKRVPHSCSASSSTGGVEPSRTNHQTRSIQDSGMPREASSPGKPTEDSVILNALPPPCVILSQASSPSEEAKSKDPDAPDPPTIPNTVQPPTPISGPQNAPPQGEGVPLFEKSSSESVILSAAKNLRIAPAPTQTPNPTATESEQPSTSNLSPATCNFPGPYFASTRITRT